MIRHREINDWCQAVAREFQPERIILFGSFAHGAPNEDSDVDVLVVIPRIHKGHHIKKAAAIRARIYAPFPMDVIVKSPEDIARRLANGDGFISDIIHHGKLMYEAKHA